RCRIRARRRRRPRRRKHHGHNHLRSSTTRSDGPRLADRSDDARSPSRAQLPHPIRKRPGDGDDADHVGLGRSQWNIAPDRSAGFPHGRWILQYLLPDFGLLHGRTGHFRPALGEMDPLYLASDRYLVWPRRRCGHSRGAVQLLSASKFARLRFGASTPWRPASACPHAAPEVPRPPAELLSGFQRRFRLILINHLPKSTGARLVPLLNCTIVILLSVDEIALVLAS